jgi:archaeoflavoprotein AfpA
MSLRILWGITGSGDSLTESVETMIALKNKYCLNIDVASSKAGLLVIKWYKLWNVIKQNFNKVYIEETANTPFLIGPIQLGKYAFLLICPATANTTAKIAHGIADSLLTNCVSQAIKAGVPIFIFPVDQKLGKVTTSLPNGENLTLSIRKVDVKNAEKLKRMDGITVLSNLSETESIFKKFL